MEYRINKKTGDKISEIGFGSVLLCQDLVQIKMRGSAS